MSLLDLCPSPPGWGFDLPALEAAVPALGTLRGCPQDPVHHAEGDVLGRALLWEAGVPFRVREAALALVRHHQLPFFALEDHDPRPRVFRASLVARLDDLAILDAADVRGRVCGDAERLLENVEFFRLYCAEQGCLDGPRAFPSPHSRFLYFRKPGRDPEYLAHEAPRCRAVVLSGLPGSGKDRWLSRNLPDRPAVSLDAIREETGIDPEEPQGVVVAEARERARGFLRRGEDFVLNATNLSRDVRGRWVDLLADYDAEVRIVYVESPARRLWAQNRERPRPVPESALRRLLDRWEVPEPWEADAVECVVMA